MVNYYPLAQDVEVTMSSSKTRSEPIVDYDRSTNRFDTDKIMKQLVVNEKSTLDERGVLSLDGEQILKDLASRRKQWPSNITTESEKVSFLASYTELLMSTIYCTPLVAFSSGRSYTATNPNRIVSDIFNNVLNTTNSPAKALQAVLTVLLGSTFYDPLSFTNYDSQATIKQTQFAFIPIRSRGLLMVIAIVCVHVLIVALVVMAFASHSNISLLNNVWQAVAQIAKNPGAAEIMGRADMMTDKETSKEVKAGEDPMRKGRKLIKIE